MQIQISWLLQKPTDLDLHCLQKQGISGFSRTRVKGFAYKHFSYFSMKKYGTITRGRHSTCRCNCSLIFRRLWPWPVVCSSKIMSIDLYPSCDSKMANQIMTSTEEASHDSSVRCTSDWWSGGCTFIPARSCNILSRRLITKYFLRSFSPFCWFKKGSCQFLAKECAQVLANCLEDYACPEISVVK